MIAAVWVLLSGLLVPATPLTAPVPAAALDTPTDPAHTHAHTPLAPAPEKRLLKYFLPSTNSWVGAGMDGNKRGYGKNYLRFGRSDDDKRGGRNFLRFGRGDTTDYDVTDNEAAEMEKRGRNFLRFGRGPNNFLRFGRAGIESGPLAFAQGMQKEEEEEVPEEGVESLPEEEKRARNMNYLRFGRGGSKNFLRFGRADNRNFLRFGRSVDRQLACEGCQEETMGNKDTVAASASSSPSSRNKRGLASAEEHADQDKQRKQRTKRNAQAFFGYSASPLAWSRHVQPNEEEEIDETAVEDLGENKLKRGYSQNYQRFARDRNFLRFGKREDSESEESSEPVLVVSPPEYPRTIRGSQRNFLRFG